MERLKRYARLVASYDATVGRFNCEFNVITELVNLHLLWDKIDKDPPSSGRWEGSVQICGSNQTQSN